MKFINAHNVSYYRIYSAGKEVHNEDACLLEVTSLEVPTESVGTVARAQSWTQRVPISGDATEKLRAPTAVCANGMVSRLVSEDLRKQAGV